MSNEKQNDWIFSKEAEDILKEKFKANSEEGTVTSYDGTVESLLKHLGELYSCTKDVQDCSTAHVFDKWWDVSKKLNKKEDYDGEQYYGYCCENNVTVVKIRNQCLVGIREEGWDGLLFSWGEEIVFEEDVEKKKYLKVDGNLLFDWSIGRV